MSAQAAVPTVGIGMPVYNGERYLAQAIESILAQSFADLELVICDNASTDETGKICASFAEKDRRVRYVRNASNLGAHPNCNLAFGLARGRYFKWAAHDDVLRPEFLGACIEALERDPGAVVCQSDIDYIDETGVSLGIHQGHIPMSDSTCPTPRFAALILRPHDCYDMMGVFRRDALERSILLPSFHGADRALLAQLALTGRFIRVPGPLLQVRDHGARYSRAQKRPKERAAWHDTRNIGKLSFPVWRLYRTYWSSMLRSDIAPGAKCRAATVLLSWWFRNFNSARMAIDLVGNFAPGLIGFAERLKQSVFTPAPGVGEVRRSRKR